MRRLGQMRRERHLLANRWGTGERRTKGRARRCLRSRWLMKGREELAGAAVGAQRRTLRTRCLLVATGRIAGDAGKEGISMTGSMCERGKICRTWTWRKNRRWARRRTLGAASRSWSASCRRAGGAGCWRTTLSRRLERVYSTETLVGRGGGWSVHWAEGRRTGSEGRAGTGTWCSRRWTREEGWLAQCQQRYAGTTMVLEATGWLSRRALHQEE